MLVVVIGGSAVPVLVVITAWVGIVWIQVMNLDSLLHVPTGTVVVAVAQLMHVWTKYLRSREQVKPLHATIVCE